MLRIDDPLAWGSEMGFSDDLMAQLTAQLPAEDMSFSASVDAEDDFGFGDIARSVFGNLNPGANFAANAWNVGTGLAEDLGFDLGPFGDLSPNANLQTNAWRTAQWAVQNIDFGDLFGGDNGARGGDDANDDGTTTLFTANGDPIEVADSLLAENTEAAADTESADSITSGVEEMVGSLFEDVLGGVSKVRSVLAAESLEQLVAQTTKRLVQRAITRVITALAA